MYNFKYLLDSFIIIVIIINMDNLCVGLLLNLA